MKELKRFLALFLCLTMLFTAVPVQVFAAEAESDEPVVTEPVVEEETPAPEETEAPAVEETDPPVVEETEAPAVEETEAPVEETEAPVEETEAPVEETEAPVEETEAPVEEPTLPEQIEEPAPDADASVNALTETSVVMVVKSGGDTTYYDTLQEAFDLIDGYTDGVGFTVADGEVGGTYTITLLADCTSATMSAKTYLGAALDVTLDLAGHTITGTSDASVLNITIGTATYPSTFTIKDSSVDENGNPANAGKITGGKWGVMFVGALATLNFEGGTITGNHGGTTGGGICASGTSNQPVVNIKGGVITGNSVTGTSSSNTGLGGGVFACQINMTGGEIYGNYAYGGTGKYTGRGGGIATPITGTKTYNVINISGGKIYDNHADNAGDDLMICKNGNIYHTLVLGNIEGYSWYIDGWNGKSQSVGETDRYSAENPVPYTDGGFEQTKNINLGLKAVETYTVTYTDGVDGEEVFADQSHRAPEGTATPAFEGTPARVGYIFGGWDPAVAETVTADVTYTATWSECVHAWGEPVFDETVLAYVSTCTNNCGATESTPVVAKLESTGTYYQTLQEALDAAKTVLEGDPEADKITLVNNTTECVNLAWLRTNGNMTLTIDLNGCTITGDGTGSVMTFSGLASGNGKFHIVIEDSSEAKTGTVTGGNGTSGGAIKLDGAKSGDSLTINGGNFVNNTASSDGGALYSAVVGAKITVNGGTFAGNTAKSGGAISAHTLVINGGVITGNSATGVDQYTGRGGAISMWGPYALSLEINGGQIYGNTAARYGDDIVFCSTNKTTASMKLMDASKMELDSVNGWYVDGYNGSFTGEANLTDRFGVMLTEFTDYANFSGSKAKGIAVALKAAAVYTVTYTDGAENEEIFADQTTNVLPGAATPAFVGETPVREGYTFGGWTPEIAETVTADVTYTAVWVPNAPDKYGKNVTPDLIRVICDSDAERHPALNVKWQQQSTKVYPGAAVEWDAELNTWKIKVRIDSISTYYVWLNFEKVYNGISHDLVPDAPLPEGKYNIDTYLKWDDESKLWVTLDEKPIDVHTTCKTAPTAPEAIQLSHYQIQVMADLDGDGVYGENGLQNNDVWELYTTSIPAEYYKDLVVRGSRDEGFFIDITVPLEDGDIFITNWIKNRAPGESFGYIWSKTEKTVSFTLKYTGDLTTNLYGTQSGDWVLTTTGEYFGKVGEAFVGKVVNVTYTDGVEGVELFADQVIEVVTGENTPAFEGTPTREGYDFAGWTPEVSETVTGPATYTATWTPKIPDKYGKNVTPALVRVICDSDPDRHAPLDIKWQHQSTKVYPGATLVWNEELNTWTIDVRIDGISVYYVWLNYEKKYNDIIHELVPDAPLPEETYHIDTTLKWDATQQLWVTLDGNPIEIHTACKTAPTAPAYNQLDSYQIKVHGLVNGEEKIYTTDIPENGYTIGEVKGSREEGFTVDITMTLEDGDAYITNWIAQRNPGKTYFYDWDKTEKTVTFTLNYNGDRDVNLGGGSSGDWVLSTTGKTFGVVSEGYIKQQVVVTYTDGVENDEIFADETYTVFVGEQTPAFQGKAERNGYTFLGWTPEVTETVTGEVTYVAQWVEQEPVYVYTVMGGDPETTELLFSGRANNGENLVAWLNANVEIPVKKGYAPESWFYLNEFGTKVSEDAVVDVWNTVYINYTVCTHTWGEPVLDTENMTHTYTCEICSETRVEKVVARIESNGAYYESLDEALEAANLLLKEGSTAETVTLVADTTECVSVTWSAAAVSTVTIDLNGHTVTGDGTGAVFYFMKAAGAAAKDISIVIDDTVGTGKVTKGVGYTNKTSTYGGAIYINSSLGGTLTIKGGTFVDNSANVGGAIHSASTDVIINGGTFTGNTAKNGGAIYASDLTITGGVITGNTATGEVDETSTSKATAGGGGIVVRGSEVHLTITGGQIYGNTAAAWGDDILYIHTNARTNSDMDLIDAASMGEAFDGWYVDGLNGVYGKGRTDRFGEDFIAAYTDLSVDTTEAKSLVLGLKAACTYSVTYTDGVEGEEVFADQVILAVPGSAAPAFDGTPVRGCYTFTGWTPEVAETVTADVTYTAQWQLSHTPGEAVIENEVKATCTKEGSYDLVVYCSECEEELSRETKTVEKLAHTPAEAVKENEVEATCTKEGSYDLVVYCSKCEEELSRETKTTEKLAHEYKDGKCEDCGEEDPDYVVPSENEVIRISGSNRIETAFKVANELKDVLGVEKFNTILLASGDNFADALAGSYLAVLKNAPILLYRANAMQQNADYISKNLAAGGTVYILGGTASVPQEMEDTLTEAGITVKRLAGSNRYNTNLEILKETGVTGGEILVATGLNYADSLSASATGKPILMVNNNANKLTDAQIAFLSKLSGVKFTIIGGTASVSEELAAALEAYGTADRVAGSSRERTSVAVAERYFTDPDWVLVAYSRNYPDGLCAGPLAYAMGAPLLLTNAGAEQVAAAYVETNGITKGLIVGGPASVTDDTVRIIFQMDADDEIVSK